jgi:hypothetical protein
MVCLAEEQLLAEQQLAEHEPQFETVRVDAEGARHYRWKCFRIGVDLLLHSLLDEGESPRCVVHGLPKGWRVERISYDHSANAFHVAAGHPSFEEVREACLLPEVEVTFTLLPRGSRETGKR